MYVQDNSHILAEPKVHNFESIFFNADPVLILYVTSSRTKKVLAEKYEFDNFHKLFQFRASASACSTAQHFMILYKCKIPLIHDFWCYFTSHDNYRELQPHVEQASGNFYVVSLSWAVVMV